jgi:TonB family protein
VAADSAPTFSAAYLFVAVYLLVVAAMLGVAVWDILKIRRIRCDAERVGGYACNVYSSPKVVSPFSFGRSIYIGTGIDGLRRDHVVAHETSHIRHGHHAEKAVMSLLRLLQWYNPFVWAARKYIIEVHEYQADSDVLAEGYDIAEYRKLIFEQVMGYNPDITCGLNGSLTKKRIIMMTKQRNTRTGWLRIGSTAMAAAGLTMLFSFTRMPDEYIVTPPAEAVETTAVVGDDAPSSEITITTVEGENFPAVQLDVKSDDGKPTEKEIFFLEWSKDPETGKTQSYFVVKDEKALAELKESMPLVIVDGERVSIDYLNGLDNHINIEYVDILRDEDAVAKYGDIAADGVIVIEITTKDGKGMKAERNEIAFVAPVLVVGEEPEKILDIVQQKAQFVGGMDALYTWLTDNLVYPQEALDNDIEGNVVVKFAVMADGSVDKVEAVSSPSKLLSAEAVRLLKSSPKWIPGKNEDKVLVSYFYLPIIFRLPPPEE